MTKTHQSAATHRIEKNHDDTGVHACHAGATHRSDMHGEPDHAGDDPHSHGHHGGGHHGALQGSPARIATSATLHCLTGCAIGEIAGLMIGVGLGLGVWPTMLLATALAYISGFTLGLRPLLRRGMGFVQALRTIWFGEAISIGVMELAMNFTDYHMGGVSVPSILHLQFWTGFLVALPAGFIAAWPVNWWLLKRRIKAPCH
jgi:hypothetical protein